jgi:hypothetical protein
MRNSLKRLFFSGVILTFFICACDEEHVPVISDPVPDPEQPIGGAFQMNVSKASICPEEKTQIAISNETGKLIDFKNFNFYLSPEIGNLNLDSGYYQAPSSLDSEVFIELWAESKMDTSQKSGKVLRIHPNVPQSYSLMNFNGITGAVDSKQLPDGSLIFASNNQAEPPGIAVSVFDFEIFCTDQKGNLLWKNNLGKGTLRRLYVGADAIYGLGSINTLGFVVAKFDFQGNHLATKILEIGDKLDYNILENLKGTVNDRGDFFISYGTYSLSKMLKLNKDLNLSSVYSMPINGSDVFSIDDSRFLIIGDDFYGRKFIVTDSELNMLWEKSPGIGSYGLGIVRAIKSDTGWEIWAIISDSNGASFTKYDLSGNLIEYKWLSVKERFLIGRLFDIVQFPNGEIWLVANSSFYPSTKPFLIDERFGSTYHLFQLSKNGDILKESHVARLNFTPPDFYGVWRFKYQGLFQGHNGIMLTGQYYYNYVIQFSPDDRYSPCNF